MSNTPNFNPKFSFEQHFKSGVIGLFERRTGLGKIDFYLVRALLDESYAQHGVPQALDDFTSACTGSAQPPAVRSVVQADLREHNHAL
nr:hypothetical protein [uncultured Rhodoferax sp.]